MSSGGLAIADDDGLAALPSMAVRGRLGAALAKPALEPEWEGSLASGRSLLDNLGILGPADAGAI